MGGIKLSQLSSDAVDLCYQYGVAWDIHKYIEQDPTIIPYINLWPNLIHSLVDTGIKSYVNNNGAVGIQTTYKIPSDYYIKTEFIYIASNNNSCIFGARGFSNPYFFARAHSNIFYLSLDSQINKMSFTLSANQSYLLTMENNRLWRNNQIVASNLTYSGNNTSELTIMGPATTTCANVKMHFFEAKTTDGNIHKFVPYYKERYGMLDLLDKQFYPPTSSEEFIYEEIPQ